MAACLSHPASAWLYACVGLPGQGGPTCSGQVGEGGSGKGKGWQAGLPPLSSSAGWGSNITHPYPRGDMPRGAQELAWGAGGPLLGQAVNPEMAKSWWGRTRAEGHHAEVQSILIIDGFCASKFTYLLKFIYNFKISI